MLFNTKQNTRNQKMINMNYNFTDLEGKTINQTPLMTTGFLQIKKKKKNG